jgi:hypothetical protein
MATRNLFGLLHSHWLRAISTTCPNYCLELPTGHTSAAVRPRRDLALHSRDTTKHYVRSEKEHILYPHPHTWEPLPSSPEVLARAVRRYGGIKDNLASSERMAPWAINRP